MRNVCALAAAAAVFLVAGASSAAVVQTVTYANNPDPVFATSSTDLINGVTPTAASLVQTGGGAAVSALADGSFGTNGSGAANGTVHITSGGLTYQLDTAANPLGYDVSSIATYSGWGDGGRSGQTYTVSYSTVAAPSTFVDITTVSRSGYVQGGNAGRIVISDDAGSLATGVAQIRFTFAPNYQFGGENGYKELDVLGVATVPEPASLALLGLGSVVALRRRRA